MTCRALVTGAMSEHQVRDRERGHGAAAGHGCEVESCDASPDLACGVVVLVVLVEAC